ncbi:MAG: uncharacterized protein A8A55_2795 [Amphiamblys sp. WSBS2006]|nr:MAG: uncharacterized protein A8A55_2795 [Amphiamblys sp. WSBS2006]
MELLELWTRHPEHTADIYKIENNSIWIGNVERLRLRGYAMEILPKLRFHEENVMGELSLSARKTKHLTGILKIERNSICVGKVKKIDLEDYAAGILPKLKLHRENEMEELFFEDIQP